jgi:hypothetical protein
MTNNEKIFIVSIIGEYRKIHESIDKMEYQLNRMEKNLVSTDRTKLSRLEFGIKAEVEKLSVYREVELQFWKEIEKKYGPGKFDHHTLEYNVMSNV